MLSWRIAFGLDNVRSEHTADVDAKSRSFPVTSRSFRADVLIRGFGFGDESSHRVIGTTLVCSRAPRHRITVFVFYWVKKKGTCGKTDVGLRSPLFIPESCFRLDPNLLQMPSQEKNNNFGLGHHGPRTRHADDLID